MIRPLALIPGVLLMLFGILFTLQGLGVVSGSAMSGKTTWAVLGPLIAACGALLVYRGTRRPTSGDRDR